TNFTRISPSASKQKNQLAEKGINNFLVTMDANFAQRQNQDKLLPNNIDSIIAIVQEVIIFFEKNNLNYNSDFKIQL
ncbi:phage tail protein, partial [Francisella tularensis subsp. holarctica]|nr:phage tail protein [Francisella tularensis subsp. holarctica]